MIIIKVTPMKPKLRKPWLAALMVACLGWPLPSTAQDNVRITGVVLDARTGVGLEGAVVGIRGTPFQEVTDARGRFYFENVLPGEYTLVAALLGYRTTEARGVQVHEDQPAVVTFRLQEAPLTLQTIRVEARRDPIDTLPTARSFVLAEEDIRNYREFGVAELLNQLPGIEVESVGGVGQRQRVRIHGSKANQVLVLLDGQRLNHPQTGEVDLSVVPLDQVVRVEYIPQGNAALYGGQALAGIIAFYTRQTVSRAYGRANGVIGSFRTARGQIGMGFPWRNVSVYGNYQQIYSAQNFRYGYEGQTFTRENAWNRHNRLFARMTYSTPGVTVSLSGQWQRFRRGLPSAYFNEMKHFNAYADEQWWMLQLQSTWRYSPRASLGLRWGNNRLYQFFNNQNDPSPFTRYKTRQWNTITEGEVWHRWVPSGLLDLRLGASYLREALQQDNLIYPRLSLGARSRRAISVYAHHQFSLKNLPFFKLLQLRQSGRLERYFDRRPELFPYLELIMMPAAIPAATFSLGWQKAIRYPDFNSLFWKGDARARGNPDLNPERKVSWDAGIRLQHGETLVSLSYYRAAISDLIYWHRGVNGVWEPRNLRDAFKEGVDILMKGAFFQKRVILQMAYSRVRALNLTPEPNVYRKQLIFIPPQTLQVNIHLRLRPFSGSFLYRYVDRRETVLANSRGTQLAPYRILDVQLGVQPSFLRLQWEVAVIGKNILGQDYQLIFGYPMPRRALYLQINVQWNPL